MARKVQVFLVDDIDGAAADETVTFALDGVAYEIDLSAANANRLRNSFAPFVGTARKVTRSTAKRPRSSGNASQIRAWAKGQGITVSERGRIPADLVAKYEASQ
ncbi:MAG TPA: Lsr2 family protein [Actinomycetes bacterium]|nr:Lsr2 family protein [Actinomycetes bacterium]